MQQGLTDQIRMREGAKLLSPDTFNLTIEVILRILARSEAGFDLNKPMLNHLAYADDIVLVADSPEVMRSLPTTMEEEARITGVTMNPAKCASLHVKDKVTRNTTFTCICTQIAALGEGDAYCHLGIPTGYQIRQTPIDTLADDGERCPETGRVAARTVAETRRTPDIHPSENRFCYAGSRDTKRLVNRGGQDREKNSEIVDFPSTKGKRAAGMCADVAGQGKPASYERYIRDINDLVCIPHFTRSGHHGEQLGEAHPCESSDRETPAAAQWRYIGRVP